VLVDVAVMLADGGEAIGDINVLRRQGQVLGPVASAPTAWRTSGELTRAALKRIERARAKVRRHVWAQLPKLTCGHSCPSCRPLRSLTPTWARSWFWMSTPPWSPRPVRSSSLPGTFKGGFGYHPLAVWWDNTQKDARSGAASG
jgi:hypothetical protein